MESSLGIFERLDIIGGMFYLYALAQFMNFWVLEFIDHDEKPVFRRILRILCVILWVASFPVSLIMYGINQFYKGRTKSLHTKELINESNKERAYMKEHEIWPLQRKVSELNCQLAWQEEHSRKMCKEGYANGFDAGFEKCLDYTYYSDEEKEALRERVRNEVKSDKI